MKDTITVELDRTDLISLLRGCTPYYNVMDKIPSDFGYFAGSHGEWRWTISKDISVEKYSNEYILELYHMCKNSWN